MKIKLIPDTNILLKHCKQLELFIYLKIKYSPFILIPQTVICELDGLKKEHPERVRLVTAFIQNNLINERVVIEGHGGCGKMDIEIENLHEVERLKNGNNDDKILGFLLDHADAIFLTGDTLFYYKVQSYNLQCLFISEFNVNDFTRAILRIMDDGIIEYNNVPALNQLLSKKDNCRRRVMTKQECVTFEAIYVIVNDVVRRKRLIGFRNKNLMDLVSLLNFVIKNFNYFMDVFINNVKKILIETKESLENNINIQENCHRLLIIFRQIDIKL